MAKARPKPHGFPLVSKNIKKLRTDRGWSQRITALKCGYSVDWIEHLESGMTLPSIPGLLALCRAFEIPLSEMFVDLDEISKRDNLVKPLVDFTKRYKLTAEQVQILVQIGKTIFKSNS